MILNSFLFSVEIVTKMEEKEVGYQRKIAELEVHLLELGKLKSFLNRDSPVLIITFQIGIKLLITKFM